MASNSGLARLWDDCEVILGPPLGYRTSEMGSEKNFLGPELEKT